MSSKIHNLQLEKFIYSLILFLISPVMSLFASAKSFSNKITRLILILFFAVFGMTMIIQDGKDAKVHADNFVNSYIGKEFDTFIIETNNIIALKSGENNGRTNVDLYLHFISYLVSQFSNNPSALFFVVSLIYGIFYIRGITKVYDIINNNNWSFALGFIFFLFIFWKSLEGINSIRNWTGAWILFNGAFSYFRTKNKKYLFLVLLAPLMHFAYALICIPFIVIFIFGNHPKIYFSVLVFSFFFVIEDINIIRDFLMLTELGSDKSAYLDQGAEGYLVEGSAQAFHAKYYLAAGKLTISVLFYYAVMFFGYLKKDGHNYLLLSLASMGILMAAFSNLLSFSTTINNRLFINGGLYMLAYLLILYSTTLYKQSNFNMFIYNTLIYISVPIGLFFVFTQLSNIGDFTDAKIFISPLTYWLFEGDYSLKQLIKELIS